jgi:hypothetical protein
MKRAHVVIEVSDDEDDVQLVQPPLKKKPVASPMSQVSALALAPPESRAGLGGLTPEERRRLEVARAARAAAAQSAGAVTVAVQRSVPRPSSIATLASAEPVASTSAVPALSTPSSTNAAPSGMRFPQATVRPTYNIFAPDDPRAIKITDLLGQVRRSLSLSLARR